MRTYYRMTYYRMTATTSIEKLTKRAKKSISLKYRWLPSSCLQEVLHHTNIILTQLNPLSANPIKWTNTLKQFVGKSRRIV